jgi:hypothetical protein
MGDNPMETRRETLSRLMESHRRLDAKLTAAGKAGDTALMKRLITVRKGLRLFMEPLATPLSK